jgi:tetratricopeptide (TPR) repeat protein
MDQGHNLKQAGNYTQASIAYREALQIAEQSGSPPMHLAAALNALAMTYDNLGMLQDADLLYRRAMTIVEKVSGRQSVDWGLLLVNMSGVTLGLGHAQQAEKMLREAISIYSRHLNPVDNLLVAVARSCLVEVLVLKGAYREAEPLAIQALAAFEKNPRQGYVGMGINNLATVRQRLGRDDEARELFERAVAMLEADKGPEHPALVYSLNNLAITYVTAARYPEAEVAFRRALTIAENRLGKAHPIYGTLLMNFAQCLRKEGRKAEAKPLEARAKTLLRDNARSNGAGMTIDASAFRAR